MIFFRQTEQDIIEAEQKWENDKKILQRAADLRNAKRQFKENNTPKMSTSKKLIWFLFMNVTILELFVGFVTFKSFEVALSVGITPDLTPLVTLVGAVISEVIGYGVYSLKSMKENTQGGITYDLAMKAKG